MKLATALAVAILTCACGERSPASEAAATGPVALVALPASGADGLADATPLPVSVRKDAAQVRIQWTAFDRPADELTAELEARDTGEIRRWPVETRPGDASGAMHVTVPAYALGAGTHVLRVWAGDADLLRRYLLEVAVR